MKFTIVTILSVQFSGVKYIHTVVQPSPASVFRSSKTKTSWLTPSYWEQAHLNNGIRRKSSFSELSGLIHEGHYRIEVLIFKHFYSLSNSHMIFQSKNQKSVLFTGFFLTASIIHNYGHLRKLLHLQMIDSLPIPLPQSLAPLIFLCLYRFDCSRCFICTESCSLSFCTGFFPLT